MRKSDMRVLLDEMILDAQGLVERLEALRAEMHNRRPTTHGRIASVPVTPVVVQRVKQLLAHPARYSQHEIAKAVGVNSGRVSEISAGKRD